MERRNWSLEALAKLKYIDSLDDEDRAGALVIWSDAYLSDKFLDDVDLDMRDFKVLYELFFKNIKFLKKYKNHIKIELDKNNNIKKFLQ